MENISIQIFLRICIIVYATEFQTAQLILIPEPCPDFAPRPTIVDMCTNDLAKEEQRNGGLTIDSVALRVMTQQDGCTCEVSLENHYKSYTVYMRKYDLWTKAAPEREACGLAIDIDYTSSDNFPENKVSVECTEGTKTRSLTLSPNGVLKLRSRIIGGNFSRGYCIQIYRSHIGGDNVGIQINCSLPNMQTTQQMTDAATQDKTESGTDSIMYIAFGVGAGVLVITLFVVVAFVMIRRKGTKNKNDVEVQPDIVSTDDDSDGLKYNTLYNASEQHEIMEGGYHTVELQGKQNRSGIQNFDSDYSTVDGNYSSVDQVNIPEKDHSSFTATPRSETQRTKEDIIKTLKHVTAGSNAEYAVVDKTGRTEQNIKHVTSPNNSNVEYAVIDKKYDP